MAHRGFRVLNLFDPDEPEEFGYGRKSPTFVDEAEIMAEIRAASNLHKSQDQFVDFRVDSSPRYMFDETMLTQLRLDDEYDLYNVIGRNQTSLGDIFKKELEREAHSKRQENVAESYWDGTGPHLKEAPCVYKIRCKRCRIEYVGSTIDIYQRMSMHVYNISAFKLNNLLYRHFREECKKADFSFHVLEYVLLQELHDKEQQYIEEYNTLEPNGLNERNAKAQKKLFDFEHFSTGAQIY